MWPNESLLSPQPRLGPNQTQTQGKFPLPTLKALPFAWVIRALRETQPFLILWRPEVLVPPDEREGLTRLVAALNEHRNFAAALLARRPEKKDVLVTVDPLQIADIEIKPLAGTETETPDGAGEKH